MKYPIGQIAEIIDGDRGANYPKQDDFSESGFCLFLNTGNVTKQGFSFDTVQFISKEKDNSLRKGRLQRGDIVYTTRGTVGNAAFYSSTIPYDNVRINSGMVILRCFDDIVDNRFLYQVLKSNYYRPYFKKFCTGSAQPQLPIKNFSTISLDIPPQKTQKRIADILSAYDDLIENNQKQIKLLEEAAQRLYKEWFIDLRFPGYENTPIQDGIPEGWARTTLNELIEFNPKYSVSKETEKHAFPMSALSTSSMVLDWSESEITLSTAGAKFSNGDTLLARITPCLENGKTAFVDGLEAGEIAIGSTEFIVMRTKRLNPYMVYLLARSADFRETAINSMTGSDGRQRAQVDKLKQYSVLRPRQAIIDRFGSVAEPLFLQIHTLNTQNSELLEARDRLLPKLMSGEIEV